MKERHALISNMLDLILTPRWEKTPLKRAQMEFFVHHIRNDSDKGRAPSRLHFILTLSKFVCDFESVWKFVKCEARIIRKKKKKKVYTLTCFLLTYAKELMWRLPLLLLHFITAVLWYVRHQTSEGSPIQPLYLHFFSSWRLALHEDGNQATGGVTQ